MKKTQVSIEIVIMIGVIVIMFILISIFSFNKRAEAKDTEDYLERRNECLKVSNLISGVYTSGDGTIVNANVKHVISVYKDGIIEVEKNITPRDSVSCRYFGEIVNEGKFSGDIKLENLNGAILIKNV